jgi:hypothetical protein
MDNKEAQITTALLKLKVVLATQRDAKRKEANAIAAEVRSLEKLITPEMVRDLDEHNKLNEPWRTRTQKEILKERKEKETSKEELLSMMTELRNSPPASRSEYRKIMEKEYDEDQAIRNTDLKFMVTI